MSRRSGTIEKISATRKANSKSSQSLIAWISFVQSACVPVRRILACQCPKGSRSANGVRVRTFEAYARV